MDHRNIKRREAQGQTSAKMVSQTERGMEGQIHNMCFICPRITDMQRLCHTDRDNGSGEAYYFLYVCLLFYLFYGYGF